MIISNFISAERLKGMTVLGTDYKPYLLEYVDEDKLPDFLGGTCKCPGGCVMASPGPWKNKPQSVKRSGHFTPAGFQGADQAEGVDDDHDGKEDLSIDRGCAAPPLFPSRICSTGPP
jgi:hypothetical protein